MSHPRNGAIMNHSAGVMPFIQNQFLLLRSKVDRQFFKINRKLLGINVHAKFTRFLQISVPFSSPTMLTTGGISLG